MIEADQKLHLNGKLNNYIYNLDRFFWHDNFVEISRLFKYEDMPKIKAFGLAYFIGYKVERNYNYASTFLMAAYLSTHRYYATRFGENGENGAAPFSNLELDILAYAAYQTSSQQYKSTPTKHQLFFSQMHNDFAAEAGHQLAKLTTAYKYRNITPSNESGEISTEHDLFEDAANCTKERLERELTPWLPEICEVARKEIRISAARKQAYFDAKAGAYNAWAERVIASGEISSIEFDRKNELSEKFAKGLISAVTTIIMDAVQNPQQQKTITDKFEEHERWLKQQEDRTWGHIGAALL
ncbi:MAG: hypothetical protein R3D32_02100 [Nitratireductor sp.]